MKLCVLLPWIAFVSAYQVLETPDDKFGAYVGWQGLGNSVALEKETGLNLVVGSPADGPDGFEGGLWHYSRNSSSEDFELVSKKFMPNDHNLISGIKALSLVGDTLLAGGHADDLYTGASWVFELNNDEFVQQGTKIDSTVKTIGFFGGMNKEKTLFWSAAKFYGQWALFQKSGTQWSQRGNHFTFGGASPADHGCEMDSEFTTMVCSIKNSGFTVWKSENSLDWTKTQENVIHSVEAGRKIGLSVGLSGDALWVVYAAQSPSELFFYKLKGNDYRFVQNFVLPIEINFQIPNSLYVLKFSQNAEFLYVTHYYNAPGKVLVLKRKGNKWDIFEIIDTFQYGADVRSNVVEFTNDLQTLVLADQYQEKIIKL